MAVTKEYFTIVRSNRRITVPLDFKEGEPIKVKIERVSSEEEVKQCKKEEDSQ